MQRLLCLGLEGQPSSELIHGTAEIWQELLGRFSFNRLAVAFDNVEASARRWPTPADVIVELPVYEAPSLEVTQAVPQIPVDPESVARAKERIDGVIAACAKNLGVILP